MKNNPPSKEKAATMLKDGVIRGHKITDKQRAYFEMIANALNGISITNKGNNYNTAWNGGLQDGGEVKKSYNSNLANKDKDFQNWYKQNTLEGKNNIPYSDKLDYDFYSFYRNGDYKNNNFNPVNHFPDTYKRPNHQTFSNESIYSTPENPGGYWENNEIFHKNGKFNFQDGGIIQDNEGYRNPDNIGKPVIINSGNISMKGIPYPITALSNAGEFKTLQPNQDYSFKGNSVLELPIASTKKWDGMVDKKDGIIGMWGNLINTSSQQYNLYPKGSLQESDVKYLRGLNDKKVNKALNRQISPNSYGESDSDMFKQLLKKNSMKNGGKLKKASTGMGLNPYNQNSLSMDNNNIDWNQYINSGGDILQGLSMLKGQRQAVNYANQNAQLTGIEAQAMNTRAQPIKRNYVRPEDMIINPNQMFPSYGTGSNILSMQDGGEISNVYNSPDTLYTDLEYESLNNSNIKNFQDGGNIQNILNSGQFGDFMNNNGNNILNQLDPYIGHVRGQMSTAGNKIGGGIGEAAGTFFGGPVGGTIGKFAGNILGGLIDTSDNKIKRYNQETDNNINNILGGYVGQSIQNRNRAFMQNGGAMNGDLQTYNSGEMETISNNPYLPNNGETVEFKGPSHDNGGIPITYGNSPVEVEGGEPATKLNNNLVVFGNLKIPNQFLSELGDPNAKNKKFKTYIKNLSEIETKQNKIVDKSTDQVNELNPITSFDKLKLTSLQANLLGANMKLKEIATKKEKAAIIQEAINDTANEYNLDADHLAQGKYKKAKNGMNIKAQQGARIDPNISSEDYLKLKDLHDKIGNKNSGQEVLDFQKALGQLAPNVVKGVLSQFPITNYGKQHNLQSFDPASNYDGIYQGRTKASWEALNPYTSSDNLIPVSDYYPNIKTGFPNAGIINSSPNNLLGINNPSTGNDISNDKFDWESIVNQALPYLRNSNKMNLDPNQLTGEMYALSNNQLEPVDAQGYHPQLSTPYDVSLQDQLNTNQSDFNSISRIANNNPEALSSLAGQKYNANSKILGEQFRLNQAEKDKVYGENRNTLNDAQLKNLQIYDTQAQRQSQARSNTKAITQAALNSISSKIAQNKLENRTLQTYENLYNYRYDNNGRAINENPLFQPTIPNIGSSQGGITYGPNGEKLYPQWKDGKFLGNLPLQKATTDEKVASVTKAKARNGSIVKAINSL